MIQNEWRKVTESRYSDTRDDYGQWSEDVSSRRTIDMVIKQYQARTVDYPIFSDVSYIGITDDFSVDTNSIIAFDSKRFGVKYTIPTRTYLEVFLYELGG